MSEYLLRLHLYVAGVFTVLTGVGSWFHHWGAKINKLVTWIWRSRGTFMWRLGNQMFLHMVTPRVGLKSRRNWQTTERLGQRCDVKMTETETETVDSNEKYLLQTHSDHYRRDVFGLVWGCKWLTEYPLWQNFVELPWYARDQKNNRLNILNNWTSLIFHTVTVTECKWDQQFSGSDIYITHQWRSLMYVYNCFNCENIRLYACQSHSVKKSKF